MNPFFSNGELNDIDEEAAARLFAESVGAESPAPTKEPPAEVVGKPSGGDDDDDDPGELRELESAERSAPSKDPLKGLFGKPKPPEEKKQENKGLRSQARDLAQQREELQRQLEEREQEIQQMRDQMRQVEEERSTYQRSLSKKFDVGQYDPNQDPEIKKIDEKLDFALKRAQISLGPDSGGLFAKHAAVLAERYNKALETGHVDEFYAFIEKNFPDNVTAVTEQVSRVSDILAERGEIQQKNQSSYFKTSIGSWEERRKSVSETVKEIGGLTPEQAMEAINSENTSANAVISYVAHSYPEFSKALDDIRQRAATFAAGVRPFDIRDSRWEPYLNPSDPTQLSTEGQKLRDAEIFNHQRSQEVLPVRLAEGLAAARLLPLMAKKIADLQARLGEDQGGEVDPDLETGHHAPGSRGFSMSEEDLDDPEKLRNPYFDDLNS